MTLLDDVAKALAKEFSRNAPSEADWKLFRPQARAALQTVALWLREPSKEMKDRVSESVKFYWDDDWRYLEDWEAEDFLSALASHLVEKEMG